MQPDLFTPLTDQSNQDFWQYHRNNPQIYQAFERKTFEAIRKGFKHSSADFIFQILRWETGVSAKDDEYKLNNNFRSYYARLFVRDHPEHADFFRFRTSKANSLLDKAA